MYSIGASSRSPSPMTMRPANSISSIVPAHGLVAAWSASSFAPRPMNRADSMAAASVTRTISSASSCSIRPRTARQRTPSKWRRPVKTMAMWWRSATSMAISSRIEPPGWMIAVTPAPAAAWMPSGNGKYASEAMTAVLARSPARRSAISTDT